MLIVSFLICSHRGLRKACMKVTPSSPYNQGELRYAAGGCEGIKHSSKHLGATETVSTDVPGHSCQDGFLASYSVDIC